MKITHLVIEEEIVELPVSHTKEQSKLSLREAIDTLCDKIIENLDEGYTMAPADYFGFHQPFEYEYKGWKFCVVIDNRPIDRATVCKISIGVDVTRDDE